MRCRFAGYGGSKSAPGLGTDREGASYVDSLQRQSSTPNLTRMVIASAVAVVLATCLSLPDASARVRGGGTASGSGAHTGVIVTSDVYLLATPFDSAATLVDAINRLQQPQAISASCGGAWRLHFAALLARPPGEGMLDLEFDDTSSSSSVRTEQRTRVFSSAVPVRSGDATVFVNDFVISKDLGFAAGHRYEVSLWRAPGSDRQALAKGTFTLK
jgi:hypothetical protein